MDSLVRPKSQARGTGSTLGSKWIDPRPWRSATPPLSPSRRQPQPPRLLLLLPLLVLLRHLASPPRSLTTLRDPDRKSLQACDYSADELVPDAAVRNRVRAPLVPPLAPNGCALLRWRLKPSETWCELLQLDPCQFLERHTDTNIENSGVPLNSISMLKEKLGMRGGKGQGTAKAWHKTMAQSSSK
ncbi:hypothetical protein ACP70R_019145 [Stipagrostis hirtigluma subsp. patula]